MFNKKAFSLIELLAVIAILAIITIIAIAIYNNISNKIEKKNYANLVTYIENAAEQFANDNNIEGIITIQDLIDAGYIIPDDKEYIYNPLDNSSLNCNKILLSYDETNNKYITKFKNDEFQEMGDNNKCNADYAILYKEPNNSNIDISFEDNIIIVLDTSASMLDYNRLQNLQIVAKQLINYIDLEKARLSIITFDISSSYINATTKDEYYDKIDNISACCSTNYCKAIHTVNNKVNALVNNNKKNYIIFISDGEPTVEADLLGNDDCIINDDNNVIYTINVGEKIEALNKIAPTIKEHYFYNDTNITDLFNIFDSIFASIINSKSSGIKYLLADGNIILENNTISSDTPLYIYKGIELIRIYESIDNIYLYKKNNDYYFDITKFANDNNIPIKNIILKY